MFCKYCGKQVFDDAVICIHCGRNIEYKIKEANDTGNIGWAFLGFFVPIVGLILYLIWKDTQPKNATAAGKGALISVIVGVVLMIIYIVIFVLFIASFTGGYYIHYFY